MLWRMDIITSIGDLIGKVVSNPVGAILVIALVLAIAILINQRRQLVQAEGDADSDKSDHQITLELLRFNDKTLTKIDKLTDALTASTEEQTIANGIWRSMRDQEKQRLELRETSIKLESQDRQAMYAAQEQMAKGMQSTVQSINELAVSLSTNIERHVAETFSRVSADNKAELGLKIDALSNTVRAETKPMQDNLQLVLQQLKAIENKVTSLADQQATDSQQLKSELRAVADQVADTAKRIESAQKPASDLPASA